jgi:hypothetical protein
MSIQSSSIDPKYLPNLPGFRSRMIKPSGKKSCFDLVDGEVYLRPQYIPPAAETDDASVVSIGNTIVTKARKHLLSSKNLILHLYAYFEESPDGYSAPQIRHCNIYFYVENGMIKVVENPQQNSGVSQGTLVRKNVIPRSDGTPYSEEDLQIGNTITIYGRNFKYVEFY